MTAPPGKLAVPTVGTFSIELAKCYARFVEVAEQHPHKVTSLIVDDHLVGPGESVCLRSGNDGQLLEEDDIVRGGHKSTQGDGELVARWQRRAQLKRHC